MYDAYISLGTNCEAGFQLRRIGYEESSFFRWTLSSYKSTYKLIQNDFINIFLKENLVPVWDNMVEDKTYKISFHSKMLSQKHEQNETREFLKNYDFNRIYQSEYQKIQHFIQKWFDLVNSDQLVLYILKEEKHGSKYNGKKLLDLLESKYPNHKFEIAYIQHEEKKEADWEFDKLNNIYFPCFAPISHADQGDKKSWDALFARFPLNQKLASIV